jgi:hypothetical protein
MQDWMEKLKNWGKKMYDTEKLSEKLTCEFLRVNSVSYGGKCREHEK